MKATQSDLICFSHLRWGFVYQRPQHLLSRFARKHRVFFFEEPVISPGDPRLEVRIDPESGVHVIVPQISSGLNSDEADRVQGMLLGQLIRLSQSQDYMFWYYTPMAFAFSQAFDPCFTVYDCMDELSAFRGAPPALCQRERELFRRADIVFTGGHTLYEAKCGLHPRVYAFPSSVDVLHFGQARKQQSDPQDQIAIPHPRIGFCGVIDERLDIELLDQAARLRPDWHFIMIGPVVKIDPATLPQHPNIHYLGPKTYKELPKYLAGWDAAMLPFARNESTRYISPTKTPEYLAAGLPTVSTSIRDVVRPYSELQLVEIADEPADFARAIDKLSSMDRARWLPEVDKFLECNSWDATWLRMASLITPQVAKSQLTIQVATVESGKALLNV